MWIPRNLYRLTLSVTLDTAEGALNRVDRVVVRWDLPQRDMYIAVLKGTPSAKPTATAVTRTTEIWELALADIYVGKGVTRIQTQNITDQRFNSAVCGIVTGTVEEIDASVLTKQFTDFFNTYSAAVLDEFSAYKQSMEKYLKRLPNYAEFCAYAFGSPAGLDNANTNAWSATSNTGRGVTGSVVNAVSSVGVVDAVGRVWEWLDELITRAEHATNADYHASVAWDWDKKSPLNTGEKSYDVGNIYQYYAYSLAALLAGGNWSYGAYCGARAVNCGHCPWSVYASIGARGACDSL